MAGAGGQILNFVGFQVGWFACILGAAGGEPITGVIAVAVIVSANLAARRWQRRDVLLLAVTAVLGYAADSALVLAGLLDFPAPARLGGPSPLWMVCMWLNLAVTLDVTFRWLRGRLVLAAALGAVSGPLSYWAGAKLGAVLLGAQAGTNLDASLAAVGVEWLIAMPLLVWFAAWIDRAAEPERLDGKRLATSGAKA